GGLVGKVEQMVLTMNCLVRDARLIQNRAQLCADTRVLPPPERAKGIVIGISRLAPVAGPAVAVGGGLRQGAGVFRRRRDQVHITVRAFGEALPVFRCAFWTNHGASLHQSKASFATGDPLWGAAKRGAQTGLSAPPSSACITEP